MGLVDDEPGIRDTLGLALSRDGYRVLSWADGASAWKDLQDELPDLLILDILLPGMDGLELCRRVRSRSEVVPILFLTSRDEEFDRVLGLELGADDYLCKPFSMRELLARVRVLFRRLALLRNPQDELPAALVTQGPLVLDMSRHQATWRGDQLSLTVTEFRILLALARRPGHVKTRQQLVEEGYPDDTYVSDRTVDTHIKRIRKKILLLESEMDPIETVYGLGYRFSVPES